MQADDTWTWRLLKSDSDDLMPPCDPFADLIRALRSTRDRSLEARSASASPSMNNANCSRRLLSSIRPNLK